METVHDTRLDETDRRILRALQADGRISNLDLALRCNISPSACSERVRRLREQGIILGYTALLDAPKVGRALLIFVEVILEKTTGEIFDSFAAAIVRAPEVLECYMVAGGFDYLIKARVQDMVAYRTFLGDILVNMPGVRETRTFAVLEEIKNTTQLAI